MDKLFTCQCGCTQFVSVTPHQYLDEDVNKWGSFGQRIFGVAPVLVCLNCNKMSIPPISMSGKSMLDPNVKAFADLMKWVEEHNKRCIPTIWSIGSMWSSGGVVQIQEPEVGKLDKQTLPSESYVEKTPAKPRNNEPRNTTKVKTKRVTKPKTKAKGTISKETTDV